MARNEDVNIRIKALNAAKAELNRVINDLKQVKTEADNVSASGVKASGGFVDMAKNLGLLVVGFELARKAIHVFTDTLSASIEETANDQLGISRLRAALVTTGRDANAITPYFEDLTDEFERQYGIVDDKLRAGFTQLTYAMVPVSQQAGIMKTAIQLARATTGDLGTSLDALIKYSAGVEVGLTRLAATLNIVIPDGASFAEVLALISKRTSAAAQAEMEGYAGTTARLSKAWRDFLSSPSNLQAWDETKKVIASILEELNKPITEPGTKAFADKEHSDAIKKLAEHYAIFKDNEKAATEALHALTEEEKVHIANLKLQNDSETIHGVLTQQSAEYNRLLTASLNEQTKAYNDLYAAKIKAGLDPDNARLAKFKNTASDVGARLPQQSSGDSFVDLAESGKLKRIAEGQANIFKRSNEDTTKWMTQNWEEYSITLAQTFANSAADFQTFFVKPTLSSALQLAIDIVSILSLFDKAANDAIARRSGRDYVKHFTAGWMNEFKTSERSLLGAIFGMTGVGANIPTYNYRTLSGQSTQPQQHFHFHGTTVTTREFVDRFVNSRIEENSNTRRSRVQLRTSMATGGRDRELSFGGA